MGSAERSIRRAAERKNNPTKVLKYGSVVKPGKNGTVKFQKPVRVKK